LFLTTLGVDRLVEQCLAVSEKYRAGKRPAKRAILTVQNYILVEDCALDQDDNRAYGAYFWDDATFLTSFSTVITGHGVPLGESL